MSWRNTEGVAPPAYYCCRNTHMPEEKSWNENKVSEGSSADTLETYFLSSAGHVE